MNKRDKYLRAIRNVDGPDRIDIKMYTMALENKLEAVYEFLKYYQDGSTILCALDEWIDYRVSKEGIGLSGEPEYEDGKELREYLKGIAKEDA